MSDTTQLGQQHQQAINYWREVAREGAVSRQIAGEHIRQQRAEEVAERTEASRLRRGLTL